MPPAIAIILNGISRKKKTFYQDIYPILSQKFSTKVFETKYPGHAVELSQEASNQGFDFIIAAGGDGTLNQVVNGMLLGHENRTPVLGLIPLGTGNDFARMCELSVDPHSLLRLINMPAKAIDIGKITCRNSQGGEVIRYFINACSIGMGPAVVKRLEKSDRSLGPFLTYWKAITTTFFTYKPQSIKCKTAFWEWHGKIRVLVIANGRSFGNSIFIAPEASVDDGILNTFIAGDIPLLKFLIYQEKLKAKKKIEDDLIMYNQASLVELSASEFCPIESEGELAGILPAKIEVLPGKISFLK